MHQPLLRWMGLKMYRCPNWCTQASEWFCLWHHWNLMWTISLKGSHYSAFILIVGSLVSRDSFAREYSLLFYRRLFSFFSLTIVFLSEKFAMSNQMPNTTWAFYLSSVKKIKRPGKVPILLLENFIVEIRMIMCHSVILKLGPSANFIVISLPAIQESNFLPD